MGTAQERGRSQRLLRLSSRLDDQVTKSRFFRRHFTWRERKHEVQAELLPSEGNEVQEDECWEVIAPS